MKAIEKKGGIIVEISTGSAAIKRIKKSKPAVVIVDAVSMRSSGIRICMSVREIAKNLPIILITAEKNNPSEKVPYADYILEVPFTARKLINRILPVLPGDDSRSLKAGPIILDIERKQVKCNGKKTTLTPRLVRLLKMLIDRRGELVDRNELFKKVWRTDYTGDTRTLDVHISWLRNALEKDPRKPEILTTVRREGYRLNVK
jgi:DNA-binding response OmpR family regulator